MNVVDPSVHKHVTKLQKIGVIPLWLFFSVSNLFGQSNFQLPVGVARVTSVEGVTEYQLPNGLHILLFPDSSKGTITINVTYLVGSRNESCGETGMAHLLEHLMFVGNPVEGERDSGLKPNSIPL